MSVSGVGSLLPRNLRAGPHRSPRTTQARRSPDTAAPALAPVPVPGPGHAAAARPSERPAPGCPSRPAGGTSGRGGTAAGRAAQGRSGAGGARPGAACGLLSPQMEYDWLGFGYAALVAAGGVVGYAKAGRCRQRRRPGSRPCPQAAPRSASPRPAGGVPALGGEGLCRCRAGVRG